MLYVTTRNKYDAQTVHKALSSDRSPEGGLYVPMQMSAFTAEQIHNLAEKTFGQCVADVLNQFFSSNLTAADVDFSIGRFPVKMSSMSHRIVIAETWRNVAGDFAFTEELLTKLICNHLGCEVKRTSWLSVAIRIAVIFGLFSELLRTGVVSQAQPMDVAVPTGDFAAAVAVWYARAMGLPIANIIVSCNENSGIWELLHLGELHTDASVVHTTTPMADTVVPAELERLVHAVGGFVAANTFAETVNKRRIYRPAEELGALLRKGMFSAVVSRSRLDALIPSVYRTNAYILGTYTALAYGGLMDYRAKTGQTRSALLIAERSPLCDGDVVADSMHMSVGRLRDELAKA